MAIVVALRIPGTPEDGNPSLTRTAADEEDTVCDAGTRAPVRKVCACAAVVIERARRRKRAVFTGDLLSLIFK